ncbi:hypothetical protein B6U99_02245 [Candidatus Geothermarchaeota archaeon ex4572_27]|nr:MAG: hypothetical protein B6U99_02245 [Candidatus Geothermarchaeota archaeon ex4572_27]
MRIVAVTRGYYGERIVENIRRRSGWRVVSLRLDVPVPKLIDDPREFLDEQGVELPRVDADLLLYMPESASLFTLLPEVMLRLGVERAIAPVDDYLWLPRGLERQLSQELREAGLKAVFPRPFCSLGASDDPVIGRFAERFGSPRFEVRVEAGRVAEVRVLRGTPCGSAYFVAEKLVGVEVERAPMLAGLYTQIYPCLATHAVDPLIGEEMIHLSAEMMKAAISRALGL